MCLLFPTLSSLQDLTVIFTIKAKGLGSELNIFDVSMDIRIWEINVLGNKLLRNAQVLGGCFQTELLGFNAFQRVS